MFGCSVMQRPRSTGARQSVVLQMVRNAVSFSLPALFRTTGIKLGASLEQASGSKGIEVDQSGIFMNPRALPLQPDTAWS